MDEDEQDLLKHPSKDMDVSISQAMDIIFSSDTVSDITPENLSRVDVSAAEMQTALSKIITSLRDAIFDNKQQFTLASAEYKAAKELEDIYKLTPGFDGRASPMSTYLRDEDNSDIKKLFCSSLRHQSKCTKVGPDSTRLVIASPNE